MNIPAERIFSAIASIESAFSNPSSRTTLHQDVILSIKDAVEAIIELLEEAQSIYWNSDHPTQREKLILSCYQVHKILPKLIGSVGIVYQMPDNVYAKASLCFALNETNDVIKSLEWCCNSSLQTPECDLTTLNSPFLSFIDIITEVGCFGRAQLFIKSDQFDKELDVLINSILKFSVDVAHVSYGCDQDEILASCQQVLRWKSDNDEGKGVLNQIMKHLEEKVSLSIISMFIEVFWQGTQPLDVLVKHVLRSSKPVQDRDIRDLHSYTNHLDLYCDALSQVGRFFILNAKDHIKVRSLVTALASLEALEVELSTAVTSYYLNPSDKGSLAYLKLFQSWWCLEVNDLMKAMNRLVDPVVFVQLTENKLISTVCNMKQNIGSYDKQHVGKVVAEVIGQGKKVAEISVQALDVDYKLEYQMTLDRLIKALVEVRVAHKRYQQDQPDYSRKLIKCLQLLVTYVHRVCDTLPGIVSRVYFSSESGTVKTKDPSKYDFPDDYNDLPVDVGTPFRPHAAKEDTTETAFDLSKFMTMNLSRKGSVRKFSMKVYEIPVDVDIEPPLDDERSGDANKIPSLIIDDGTLTKSISRLDELINSFMLPSFEKSVDSESDDVAMAQANKSSELDRSNRSTDFSANIMADDATEQEIEEATSALMRRLTSNMCEYSISQSSAEVSTLKRLEDLQLVQNRLQTLRDLLSDNSS